MGEDENTQNRQSVEVGGAKKVGVERNERGEEVS